MKIHLSLSISLENIVVAGFLIFFLVSASFSQSILRNKDVIELIRAGLDAEVVVEKINASDTEFDTSTDGLIKLTEAKVPKTVITAMIKKDRDQADLQKTISSKTNDALASIPEQGQLADLKTLKKFFVSTGDSKARERIVKEVSKLGFVASDSYEDANFYLTYREWQEAVQGSQYLNKIGTLEVFTVSEIGRKRNIYTTRKEKFYVFTAEPAEAVAKQFVKDFKTK